MSSIISSEPSTIIATFLSTIRPTNFTAYWSAFMPAIMSTFKQTDSFAILRAIIPTFGSTFYATIIAAHCSSELRTIRTAIRSTYFSAIK
jgi:hypothetical protein